MLNLDGGENVMGESTKKNTLGPRPSSSDAVAVSVGPRIGAYPPRKD